MVIMEVEKKKKSWKVNKKSLKLLIQISWKLNKISWRCWN